MGPEMRASYVQDNLGALALLGADVEARVLSAVPDAVTAIRAAARVDWLPLSVDVALTAAVADATGSAGVRDWSKRALLRATEGPLLRPILSAVVSIFGLTPASLLKRAPTAWNQIYRGCGALSVDLEGEHRVALHVDGAAPLFFDHREYIEGTCGTFSGVLALCKVDGAVEAAVDPGARRITYTVTW